MIIDRKLYIKTKPKCKGMGMCFGDLLNVVLESVWGGGRDQHIGLGKYGRGCFDLCGKSP